MDIQIRDMMESDILDFHKAFKLQGWDKPIKLFEKYYKEQKNGVRKVFIAVKGEQVLGYATLLPNAQHGPLLISIFQLYVISMFLKSIKEKE